MSDDDSVMPDRLNSATSDDFDDDDHPITLNSFARATQSLVRSNKKIDKRFIDLHRISVAKRSGISIGFHGLNLDSLYQETREEEK